jgi:uncharacterized membrane protein
MALGLKEPAIAQKREKSNSARTSGVAKYLTIPLAITMFYHTSLSQSIQYPKIPASDTAWYAMLTRANFNLNYNKDKKYTISCLGGISVKIPSSPRSSLSVTDKIDLSIEEQITLKTKNMLVTNDYVFSYYESKDSGAVIVSSKKLANP